MIHREYHYFDNELCKFINFSAKKLKVCLLLIQIKL